MTHYTKKTIGSRLSVPLIATFLLASIAGCGDFTETGGDSQLVISTKAPSANEDLQARLTDAIVAAGGVDAFTLPGPNDLAAFPHDPMNPLTDAKVDLGRFLFHETGLSTDANDPARAGEWSCASCHHVDAGFKSGIPQGIGEGGERFDERRRLARGMDPFALDGSPLKPDLQPVTSPTILNSAFQSVMLWNGQFGNSPGGPNALVPAAQLLTPGTPKAANILGLSGLETQAIAGIGVHRLSVDAGTVVQTNPTYSSLYAQAFPGAGDVLVNVGKAIAAYERTVVADQAPFQQWLKGDMDAMSKRELRGALLFFGKAGCVECHKGPALSSPPGADASDMFFAVGFADFNLADPQVHGAVSDADRRGRGGFTGLPEDDYKFKIPPLYNGADTRVFGHGASFKSIREVIQYKNAAISQNTNAVAALDPRFVPLNLSDRELDELTKFLTTSLRDPNLDRYVPLALPTGNCFPVADKAAIRELGCKSTE